MNIERKYYKSMSDIIFINVINGIKIERQAKIKNFALQGFFVI